MKKLLFLNILFGLIFFSKAQITENHTISIEELLFSTIENFDAIEIKDYSFTDEIGNPHLPVKIVSFVLPYNSTVLDVQINSVTEQKLNGSFYIFPAQPLIPLDWSDPPPFVEPNLDIYNSNNPYPNKTVEIINDGYTHGYHIVTVVIYPVVYYPSDREIYLRNISFTINYNNSFDRNLGSPFEKQSYRRYELGKQFVQSMVKNANDVENCRNTNAQIIDYSSKKNEVDSLRGGSISAIDILVPDYIIITNNELKPIFQQLADWKTKKGVPAIIKTVEEIEQLTINNLKV